MLRHLYTQTIVVNVTATHVGGEKYVVLVTQLPYMLLLLIM